MIDSKDVLMEIEKYREELEKYYRYLHKNPGIGFDIEETYKYVKHKLVEFRCDVKSCGKMGLYTDIGIGSEKDIFLLRADMDALPIKEETGLEFASKNGYMHACGHDMHTAMLLGAAKYLKYNENKLKGKVRLMFQPAEELLAGAKDMIDNGILEGVTGAMMLHTMAGVDNMDTGTAVVAQAGVTAPAADYFTIDIEGKGCHGSMPSQGIDPINIAAHIIIALQEINARELMIGDKAVLTVGRMMAGDAANVIPDKVKIKGTMRTYDEEVREFIKKRLTEIATHTAVTFRGKAEVSFDSGCPSLFNDKDMCIMAKRCLKELLDCENDLSIVKSASGGSEDFAYVSRQVPSVMIALCAGSKKDGYEYTLHHPKVRFDTSVLTVGSAIYAYLAFAYFERQ